jgi:aspartyl protease family protein
MRNVLLFAAVIAGAGVLMAQMADRMAPAPAHANVARSEPVVASAPAGVRSISIAQDGRGHFQTDARIDGQRIDFMVDTGASVVALNERSAARFGLRPQRSDYNATVATANGSLKAARARIPMMDVGGLIVRDVEAMVLPDEALSENLLGLSFLSKLRRFEYANGRLVLEQ